MRMKFPMILAAIFVGFILLSINTNVYCKKIFLALPSPITEGSLERQVADINEAKADDIIYVATDSPGGSVNEMLKMVKALKKAKARSLCYVEDYAASAAAVITISCTQFAMKPEAILLFHMPSQYYSIGSIDLFKDTITVNDWCPAHASYAYEFAFFMEQLGVRRLMTERQWKDMLFGKDIILSPKDIAKNLGRR